MLIQLGPDNLNLVALALHLVASLLGAGHALLSKRDPRSAAAWISLCVLFPVVGVLLYLGLGNNRIRTRARQLHALPRETDAITPIPIGGRATEHLIAPEYRNLAYLGFAASANELVTGNTIEPLFNGDEAYPAMLAAIAGARHYIYLATYIFETRGVGRQFITALVAAQARGVDVRVLLDGFGELYTFPLASFALRKADIPCVRFLPPRLLPPNFSVNLRNHRKILVVDGEQAFTGGMNLRGKHVLAGLRRGGVVDIHFQLRGPIVAQIEGVFRADWSFCAGQPLPDARPEPPPFPGDTPECRVIVDGPNEDMDKMMWVLVGAIAASRESIKIMTPYFLPPRELTVALQIAALRGVDVSVMLPAHNNFVFMTWAAMHTLGPLLKAGLKVYFSEGPFVHSKLFLVDDYYVQIGSSNLDPRSLRLNFELAVEVYDRPFAERLADHFSRSLEISRRLSLDDWRRRSLPRRLRDAFFWLFSPYL